MTYSVWNQAARAYDYFETRARSRKPSAPAPRHLQTTSRVGTHPEAAAWPLPTDAKRVGRGSLPRGFIASRSSGLGPLGALPFDLTGPNLIVIGIIGFLAYQHFWKDKR